MPAEKDMEWLLVGKKTAQNFWNQCEARVGGMGRRLSCASAARNGTKECGGRVSYMESELGGMRTAGKKEKHTTFVAKSGME